MGKNYPGSAKVKLKSAEQEFQEQEEYLRGLPHRMLLAAARGEELQCVVSVKLSDRQTPEVRVAHHNGVEYILNYDTEPWEMDACEQWLNDLEDEEQRRRERYQLAKQVAEKLSKEELAALKEFF